MLKFLFALAPRVGLGMIAGPAGAIVGAGASVFQAMVAFFSTTLGKYVGMALIGFGLFVAGEVHRGRADAARWAAEIEASQEAGKARDAEIAKQTAADADARIADATKFSDALQQKVAEYEKALQSSKDAACRARPDDVKRLRKL